MPELQKSQFSPDPNLNGAFPGGPRLIDSDIMDIVFGFPELKNGAFKNKAGCAQNIWRIGRSPFSTDNYNRDALCYESEKAAMQSIATSQKVFQGQMNACISDVPKSDAIQNPEYHAAHPFMKPHDPKEINRLHRERGKKNHPERQAVLNSLLAEIREF